MPRRFLSFHNPLFIATRFVLRIQRQFEKARAYLLRIILCRRNYAITVRRHKQFHGHRNFQNNRHANRSRKALRFCIIRAVGYDCTHHRRHRKGHNRGRGYVQQHVLVNRYRCRRRTLHAVGVGKEHFEGHGYGGLHTRALSIRLTFHVQIAYGGFPRRACGYER